MEDVKKRGRPAAAPKSDGNDSGGEAAAPKKRGRPAKLDKAKKKPPSGRGRGRPAKNAAAKPSDGEDNAVNGAGESGSASAGGRGKKGKITHQIVATGKGRGRPKNPPKSDHEDEEEGDDDEDGDDDDDDDDDVKDKKQQKLAGKQQSGNNKAPKKRGRPQKPVDSDSNEATDDEDKQVKERKPLGRPPTGGIRLNIVATGRGQGRPKKTANGLEPKKRGRKPSSKTVAKLPTGKPRGRPGTKATAEDSRASSMDDQDSLPDEDDEPQSPIANGKKSNNHDNEDSVALQDTSGAGLGDEEADSEDESDKQHDDNEDDKSDVELPAAAITTAG